MQIKKSDILINHKSAEQKYPT